MLHRGVKQRCCNVHIHTSVTFKRQCSNKVKVRWKILLAAYPQMISGYDAERIIKIGQYLQKLQ